VNYRANLWALKELAVSRIIAVNAVGGINPTMPPESIVIPDQLIDYSYGREQSFFDGLSQPLDHIDFSQPFSPACCQDIAQAAQVQSIAVHRGGVYGVTQGPRLETVAEINRMANDGCDMVGMTAMPEAALARELGIDYASICLVVNPAAGRADGVISMADIHAVIERGMLNVKRLLLEVIG